MTVNITTAENAAEINMDATNKTATLKVDDKITHELEVIAEDGELNIYKKVPGELPVKVITSAAQEATVTVTGEYAYVNAVAIDPVGNIASTACVRLFRSGYEIASGCVGYG